MKMKSILLSMLAVATLASCNKEDVTNDGGSNKPQTLTVTLPSNINTRAVDDEIAGPMTSVNDAVVFLLNGETVVETEEFTSAEVAAKFKRFEQVSGGINKVIVLANVQGQETPLKALTTGAAVRKYAFTIASQQSSSVSVPAKPGVDHVTLLGEGTPTTTTPDDGHDYKTVTIDLDAVVARIEVGAVYGGTGIASVQLNGVFINNYFTDGTTGTVKLHASNDNVWDYTFTSGQNTATPVIAFTNPYTELDYYNAASASVTQTAGSQVYAFQVFAGNVPHVTLCVSGEYAPGYYNASVANSQYFTKWITFVKYKAGASVPAADKDADGYILSMKGNNNYKMGVGATGIKVTPEIITPDPETGKQDIGITVVVNSWKSHEVAPEV